MFGTLGGPELFLIFVVGLVVFGPRKLPEIGKSLGKMIAEFKRASAEFQKTVEDEVESEKLKKEIASTDYGIAPASEPALTTTTASAAPVIRGAEGTVPVSSLHSSPLAELSEEAGLPTPPKREGEAF